MKILIGLLFFLSINSYAGQCVDTFRKCIRTEDTCADIPVNSKNGLMNRQLCAEGVVVHCVGKINSKFGEAVCRKELDDALTPDDDDDDGDDLTPVYYPTYSI